MVVPPVEDVHAGKGRKRVEKDVFSTVYFSLMRPFGRDSAKQQHSELLAINKNPPA